MKNFIFSILLLAVVVVSAILLWPKDRVVPDKNINDKQKSMLPNDSFIVSPELSSIGWAAQKVIGSGHTGTVKVKSGAIRVEDGRVLEAQLVLDMNTIEDVDRNERLIQHLKSPDFFDVAQFNEATFKLTSVTPEGVEGQLTIKGITQGVKVPGVLKLEDGKYIFEADYTLDRTLWDIRYGSGKFFQDLGDKMIKDDIQFKIKLVAQRV